MWFCDWLIVTVVCCGFNDLWLLLACCLLFDVAVWLGLLVDFLQCLLCFVLYVCLLTIAIAIVALCVLMYCVYFDCLLCWLLVLLCFGYLFVVC